MTFTVERSISPVLKDNDLSEILGIAVDLWRKGFNTYEIAVEAGRELGKRINECVVANLLAGYFAGGR